ncbi:HAD family hydrolase [Ruegeria hyattellae]|uniref:HAD family hydrolase n=1 Tax=Ruegeria hyattellae TaxID=3233337 RepID=UPI00355C1B7C
MNRGINAVFSDLGSAWCLKHIVWDWNGTLLDDFRITAEIARRAVSLAGGPDLDNTSIRSAYTRPASDYLSALTGRTVTESELKGFNALYDQLYVPVMYRQTLANDAIEAIDLAMLHGCGQSILSMAPHGRLIKLLQHFGIHDRFKLVEGRTPGAPSYKTERISSHLNRMGLTPKEVCLIGDTIEDYETARLIGCQVVLVTTGMQSEDRLRSTGALTRGSLFEAVVAALAK